MSDDEMRIDASSVIAVDSICAKAGRMDVFDNHDDCDSRAMIILRIIGKYLVNGDDDLPGLVTPTEIFAAMSPGEVVHLMHDLLDAIDCDPGSEDSP